MVVGNCFTLSATVLLAAYAFDLCLVTSDLTPEGYFTEFSGSFSIHMDPSEAYIKVVHVIPEQEEAGGKTQGCALVLDASADPRVATELQLVREEGDFVLIGLSLHRDLKDEIHIHPEDQELLPYLQSTLVHFNWTSTSLLYSPTGFGSSVQAFFSTFSDSQQSVITEGATSEMVSKIISKEVKRHGSNIVIVATAQSISPLLFETLTQRKMMKEGYAYIVVGEAIWGRDAPPGLLQLREQDCVTSATLTECDADRVAATIERVSEALGVSVRDLTATHFASFLALHGGTLPSETVLVNTKAGGNAIIGRFDSSKTLIQVATVYFPGNVTSLPKFSLGTVEIAFNSGIENPTVAPTTAAATFYRGQTLAVQHINARSDILPKQTLVSNNVSFGAAQWVSSWAEPRILQNKDRLGVAYMAGYASAVTLSTLQALDRLNLSRPAISSSNSLIALGNSTAYPWFVRNGISDLYYTALFTNIFPVFGWKRCAVLYGDDIWGTSVYQKFKDLASSRHIDILNNETLRMIPALWSKQQYWTNYRDNLLELFRCNARIVIVFALDPVPQYILELMFDLGARKGDFVFSGAWLTGNYVTRGTALNTMKHKELLEGTVGFSGTAWIGPVGESVRRDVLSTFNDTDPSQFVCFYYDSTFALAHAIDSCTQFGEDYENPHKLMQFLRETRFIGCTGFISWLSGENNRAYVDYNIMNLVRNDTTGVYALNTVGRYSPTSVTIFNFTAPLFFPDGTSTPPLDLRVVLTNCPFEEKYRHTFTKGRNLAIGVCVIVIGITALVTFFIYKRVWSVVVPDMQKHEISVEDVVFMATIGIEAVQLAAMGPDFKSLNSLIMTLAQMLTVDLGDVITFRKGVYWISLDVALVVVGAWTFLNVFSFLRLEEKLSKFYLARLTGTVAYMALPLLGNVCFVPIIFVLLDVYVCDSAVGSGELGYLDSVLTRDCYVTCWRGTHLHYMLLSSASLLIYVPSAILLRPVWQEFQDSLHVKTYPLFVVIKSLLQVTFICLSKTVKRWASVVSGVIFLSLVAVFLVYIYVFRAYNYGRANLWQGLSVAAVLVLNLVALIDSTSYNDPNFRLVIVVAVAWALLVGTIHAAFGLVYQARCLPSMLYKKPGRDFSKIIQFAFSSRVMASEINPKLNFAKRKEVSITSEVEISNISQTFRE